MDRAQKYEHDHSSAQGPRKGPSYLTQDLLEIKARLAPLLQVERTLIRRLTGGGSELIPTQTDQTSRGGYNSSKQGLKEIAINSTIPWKNAFNRLVRTEERTSFDSADGIDWDDPEDPWPILNQCMHDMQQLWDSAGVKQLLVKQKIKPEDLNE